MRAEVNKVQTIVQDHILTPQTHQSGNKNRIFNTGRIKVLSLSSGEVLAFKIISSRTM